MECEKRYGRRVIEGERSYASSNYKLPPPYISMQVYRWEGREEEGGGRGRKGEEGGEEEGVGEISVPIINAA